MAAWSCRGRGKEAGEAGMQRLDCAKSWRARQRIGRCANPASVLCCFGRNRKKACASHQRVCRVNVVLRQLHMLQHEVGAGTGCLCIALLAARGSRGGRQSQRWVGRLPRLGYQQNAVGSLQLVGSTRGRAAG